MAHFVCRGSHCDIALTKMPASRNPPQAPVRDRYLGMCATPAHAQRMDETIIQVEIESQNSRVTRKVLKRVAQWFARPLARRAGLLSPLFCARFAEKSSPQKNPDELISVRCCHCRRLLVLDCATQDIGATLPPEHLLHLARFSESWHLWQHVSRPPIQGAVPNEL